MPKPRNPIIVLLLLLVLGSQACGESTSSVEPLVTAQSETQETAVLYLEEVIPPCTPVEGSDRDPCTRQVSQVTEPKDLYGLRPFPLTIAEYLQGGHIVVRGTMLPDTTRCGAYPVNTEPYKEYGFEGLHHTTCFTDVRVNDYVIEAGPPRLTVRTRFDPHGIDPTDPDITEEKLEELAATTAALRAETVSKYEGAETILFLYPQNYIVMEVWAVGYFLYVLEVDGEVRVVAPGKELYPQTPENLALLDFSLTDFKQQVVAEGEARAVRNGGREGEDPSSPMLVTDANQLRDYYEETGYVYNDPEKASLPPIPAPLRKTATAETTTTLAPATTNATG